MGWSFAPSPAVVSSSVPASALGFSSPPSGTDKNLTHIFWRPTGPFFSLPIHAVGLYDTAEAGTKLSGFASPSYFPTLTVLAPSPQNGLHDPSTKLRLLVVPQPPTDGLNPMFSAQHEVDSISEICNKSPLVTLQNSDGIVEDVTEKLKNTDWVHVTEYRIPRSRSIAGYASPAITA